MPEWISPALSALTVLFGLGINLFLAGRMVSKVTEGLAHLSAAVAKLTKDTDERFEKVATARAERAEKIDKRFEDLGDEVADEAGRRAGFEQRLGQVEDAAKVMWDVRDKLTGLIAGNDVHEQYRRDKWDKLEREVAGVSRQLGTIAAKGLEYRPGKDTT